jgi:predicted enzyme involved in methoxymalonyl-ACP biosynthesis
MAYMIYGQKAKLLKTYFDASSKNKTIRNFYEEAVQVYYIHQDNLDYFYNYIVE